MLGRRKGRDTGKSDRLVCVTLLIKNDEWWEDVVMKGRWLSTAWTVGLIIVGIVRHGKQLHNRT